MLIRNILEESVQKFGEVKAVKWLNRKEVLERSSGEKLQRNIEKRDFHQKRTSCRRLCRKAYCIDRNQFCRMDRKLSGNYYRMYYSGAAGRSTPM